MDADVWSVRIEDQIVPQMFSALTAAGDVVEDVDDPRALIDELTVRSHWRIGDGLTRELDQITHRAP
jgi:hypothetical protein